MTVSVASADDCVELALAALDLRTTEINLFAPEGLAASLRRAASFLCPAAPRQLVDAVLEALRPLRPDAPPERDDLNDMVELLVSAGDLIELPPDPKRRGRLLYLGPPSFVEKRPGRYLLMGIRPYGVPLLPADLDADVRYERHVRTAGLDPTSAAKQLRSLGLHPIAPDRWASAPASQTPHNVIANARARLDVVGAAGEVASLTILDPSLSMRYYRGRWCPVRPDHTGDFVARRSQEYGADLWCYVRIVAGVPVRLIDFPIADQTAPGRDEAWQLQAAIDAAQDRQHVFRLSPSEEIVGSTVVDFLAPIPTWAERYLELVGIAIPDPRGALFSYLVPNDAVAGLSGFFGEMLWMLAAGTGGTS
jgi:hypothetical protein